MLTLLNFRVWTCSTHTPWITLIPAHGLDLHSVSLGRYQLLICSFYLVRLMYQLQWTVPPPPFPCLGSLLTMLIEGASLHGSCAFVSESGNRKRERLWCHSPQKSTISVMTVNTNFPLGLQRLRIDFSPELNWPESSQVPSCLRKSPISVSLSGISGSDGNSNHGRSSRVNGKSSNNNN